MSWISVLVGWIVGFRDGAYKVQCRGCEDGSGAVSMKLPKPKHSKHGLQLLATSAQNRTSLAWALHPVDPCKTCSAEHLLSLSPEGSMSYIGAVTLEIKIAQKPYIVWSLGPKALIYESLDP